ncbi:M24 family metallopeptidase [bacterium]|nr:M24 family metallopeptidase [bacterium]
MFPIADIQTAIRELGFDGWLIYDFRKSNPLARRVLQLDDAGHSTRRWMYFIPATGEPRKLVHRIESGALDHLPGDKTIYLRWQEFEAGVESLIRGCSRIAMEYTPRNANPYVSRVDAGTVELVRSFGAEVVSSGNLVQMFESRWDDEQWQMHLQAGEVTNAAFTLVWKYIAEEIRRHGQTTEKEVQQQILAHFARNGVVTDHAPIVGANAHAGDPHYETGETAIRAGDLVLVDLWAKLDHPKGVFSDLTRMGFVGETIPTKYADVFAIVAAARDAGIQCVREAFAAQRPLQGWEVDDATRGVIDRAGYGAAFVHRTGHSIGRETHGNGANMDNLETHEERLVLPGCCFSIEPGIYLPEFGIRSEINVFVGYDRTVHVTAGEVQTAIQPIVV